jgi:hypothetical protein
MPCLYIAQGVGGLIKAGMTSNIKNRLGCLRWSFRKYGDQLARYTTCEELESIGYAERDAQYELAQLASKRIGREWFHGVNFDEAVSIARAQTALAKQKAEA